MNGEITPFRSGFNRNKILLFGIYIPDIFLFLKDQDPNRNPDLFTEIGYFQIDEEFVTSSSICICDLCQSCKFNFVIYGSLGEKIMDAYEKGQYITVQYKVERSKHIRDDGKTDYYTNYVVEKIS